MDPTVTIWCLVYNHGPYLRQCLDGFVMQKTDFSVEALIHDDASTDDSAKIILEYAKKYPDIIKPIIEKENLYSKHDGSLMRVQVELCKGKYIAFCEGDDYWTDPYKLQKQVDFMEANPDYGMCHTDFVLSDGKKRKHYKERYPDGNYFPGNLEYENVGIGTLTVLFRKETFDKTPKYYLQEPFVAGDKPRWYELSKEAKVKYIPEVTACYRVLQSSASHSPSIDKMLEFREGLQYIRIFYAEKFGVKITDYKNYYTNCLRACYIASNAEKANSYYSLAKKCNSLTRRGTFFYLGTKCKFIKKLVNLWAQPK